MTTAKPLPRRRWAMHLLQEIAYVAWRTVWRDTGQLWCRHSWEAGEFLHELSSPACHAMNDDAQGRKALSTP